MKNRTLKEKHKREIREAFRIYTAQGIPEESLVRLCADHAIGLLQLHSNVTEGWFEDNDQTKNS